MKTCPARVLLYRIAAMLLGTACVGSEPTHWELGMSRPACLGIVVLVSFAGGHLAFQSLKGVAVRKSGSVGQQQVLAPTTAVSRMAVERQKPQPSHAALASFPAIASLPSLSSQVLSGGTIRANLLGQILILENRSTWEIAPLDAIKTAYWMVASQVQVYANPASSGCFPFLLVNRQVNVAAAAKFLNLPNARWGQLGVLVGGDRVFLGTINANQFDSDSIVNSFGDHGSEFGSRSVFNRFSKYGDSVSNLSAFCSLASEPPRLFVGDRFVAYVTRNSIMIPAIDPLQLKAFLIR